MPAAENVNKTARISLSDPNFSDESAWALPEIPRVASASQVKDFSILFWTSFQNLANFELSGKVDQHIKSNPMKKTNLSSCLLVLVLAVGLFAVASPAAAQGYLIEIDLSNSSAVQFIATGNDATSNDSSQYNFSGVDLMNFFTASVVSGGGSVAGSLTPVGTTASYNKWSPDNLLNGPNNVDLNLYVTSAPQLQTFSTSGPAFTGTATVDLSSLLAYFSSSADSGPIYSGYSASSPLGQQIGEWVILPVPEPSVGMQLTLGAVMFAGLVFIRRARRAASRR